MITRRDFVSALAGGVAAPALFGSVAAGESEAAGAPGSRKKIAFLGTCAFRHSHAQHFLDRLAMGYASGGRWVEPKLEVASVFLDQFPENDIGRQRIAKYGLKRFPTVAEALTLGGEELAVDGVILIGEHGDYPMNAKGQTRYPRYAWFKEVVKVFEASGRSVPVFNDKHLSTEWAECVEMVEDAERLGFPFYAGSSLPVTWRLPAFDLPYDTPLKESVCVAYGGVDSYDFHALETAQCMSERRQGGEVGIRSVHAVTNERCWELLAQREATSKLFVSALCRSHNLPVETGYPTAPITIEWARRALPNTTAYFVEHLDGFRTTIFLTGIRDFNYAGMRADNGEIIGCQFMLPMPGSSATTADFFTPLIQHIEQMILRGSTPYPIARTLLTSGMVIGGVESLAAGEKRYATPEMAVAYRGPRESMYWQQ
ncbi:hypothetical protein [Candidatus Laterigemmans baculatus]|uniref:hypothetical protein n=1 Tax=Candidatus Laterigemmans baculatus TaxID=2770505 RepID=UPI0013D8FBA3|nr:hypothetical protein [Candidatus Laterigemmans baculatus]